MKKSLLLFLCLLLPAGPAHAGPSTVTVENPAFQGAAQADLNLGGHNLTNAGTVSATALTGALPWSSLTGLPTTLSGYGIGDPVLLSTGTYTNPAWLAALAWSKLTGTPTTLAGYGITDNVTTQGNSFNGNSQLVKTTGGGALPALSGAGLTGLVPSQLSGGSGASYLFVGDSITYGQYLSSPTTQCFQAVFATLPFCDGATTRNVGVPGWKIADITGDYTTHVQPHRPTANGGDGGAKATLVLMIGINDAFSGRTGAQMISDVTSYITTARSDGFTVVLATILPSTNAPTSYPAQQSYNEAIRAGLVPYDLLWDANSLIADPTNTSILSDGIHPTAAVDIRLASSLQAALMTQGGAVGAPSLYTSDLVTVGKVQAGGAMTAPVGASGGFLIGSTGLALTSEGAIIPGRPNVIDDANGSIYLEPTDATHSVRICAINQAQVCIGTGGLSVGGNGNPGPVSTLGPTLGIKSGTNCLAGTVTLSSGAATLTSSAIDANTVIILSLKTSSGTPGSYTPRASVSSGSATVTGLSTDNSTYNWIGLKVN